MQTETAYFSFLLVYSFRLWPHALSSHHAPALLNTCWRAAAALITLLLMDHHWDVNHWLTTQRCSLATLRRVAVSRLQAAGCRLKQPALFPESTDSPPDEISLESSDGSRLPQETKGETTITGQSPLSRCFLFIPFQHSRGEERMRPEQRVLKGTNPVVLHSCSAQAAGQALIVASAGKLASWLQRGCGGNNQKVFTSIGLPPYLLCVGVCVHVCVRASIFLDDQLMHTSWLWNINCACKTKVPFVFITYAFLYHHHHHHHHHHVTSGSVLLGLLCGTKMAAGVELK